MNLWFPNSGDVSEALVASDDSLNLSDPLPTSSLSAREEFSGGLKKAIYLIG